MLRIAHLNASYGGQPVLQDISLRVEDNALVVVLGPSGCGKTTLLNLIAGFLPVESGSISLDGKAIQGPGADRGVVFQHEGLLPWRNVLDNVAFGLQIAGMARQPREALARQMIKMSGWKALKSGISGSYLADSVNALASPVRWLPIPACYCSMNRLAHLMRLPVNKCRPCC